MKWLVTDLVRVPRLGTGGVRARVRRGLRPEGFPDGAAALLSRHAPVAEVMEGFERRFGEESRSAAFPAEALRRIPSP